MDTVGILAFAFGNGTGSNGPIGRAVSEIARVEMRDKNRVLGVTQPEVYAHMRSPLLIGEWHVAGGNEPDSSTRYTSTKDVLLEGLTLLEARGVKPGPVILAGHPHHMRVVRTMVRLGIWKMGNWTIDRHYDNRFQFVPYDKSNANTQWWTRHPVSFTAYLAKTFVTKSHG